MSDELVESLGVIRSHALALRAETAKIIDDIDAGRLQDAAVKVARVEDVANELGHLFTELPGLLAPARAPVQ